MNHVRGTGIVLSCVLAALAGCSRETPPAAADTSAAPPASADAQPASASNGQQKLYVAGTESDAVYVIDVATHEVVKTLPFDKGSFPHGFAAPDGGKELWIVAEDHGTIVKIDTRTDAVLESHKLGREVHEIEITSDGRLIYAPMFNDHCYFVFDTQRKEIVARLPVNGSPHNVVRASGDDRYMFLSPMMSSAKDMAERAKRLNWPARDCNGKPKDPVAGDRIYIADTTTNTIVGEVKTGTAPRPITASKDGARVYVNVDQLLGFVVIDPKAQKVVERVEFPLSTEEQKTTFSRSHGIWVTPDQKQVWATSVNHDLVYVYDRTVEPVKFVKAIPVGGGPYWLSFSTDGKFGYVSNAPQGEIAVVDTATLEVVKHIKLPEGAHPKTTWVVDVPMS